MSNQNLKFAPTMKHVDGYFRITSRAIDFTKSGVPFHQVEFSNATQTIIADVYDCDYLDLGHQRYLGLVYLAGEVVETNEKPIIELNRLESVEEACFNLAPLQSLPVSLSPFPNVVKSLASIANRIQNPHLRAFVRTNLDRNERVEFFLRVPASISFHHSYKGGLAVHTLEVVRNIIGMINYNEPDMDRDLVETAVVAALFHDIGKIWLYGLDGRPHEAIQLINHDALTLELCAEGFKHLDTHEPQLAMLLRHIWTCSSPGARYGKEPMHTIARYLRDADAQSASADDCRIAKLRAKNSGICTIGNRKFWWPQR